MPSKPLQKKPSPLYNFLLLLHLPKAFGTVDHEHILRSSLTKSVKTPHDECTDQWCDTTKYKDWKATLIQTSTHIRICQGDCLLALLCIQYLAFAVKLIPPASSCYWLSQASLGSPYNWSRCTQDHYQLELFWWCFIPEIKWVKNQSSWKRDICCVAHRRLACKWKQNWKVSHTKRWRRCLEKCKYLGWLLDAKEDIKGEKGLKWLLQDIQIYFQLQGCQWKIQDNSICNIHPITTQKYGHWHKPWNIEHSIDVSQRNLLRRIINVKRPRWSPIKTYLHKLKWGHGISPCKGEDWHSLPI